MIRAIIFDFGRVVTAQKPASLFHQYEDELGLARNSINRIMFDSEAWQKLLVGRITSEEYWRVIGPQMGLHTVNETRAFYRRYREDEHISVDVRQILKQLYGRYKLALFSNAPPGLDRWLVEWGIRDLFDVVFSSAEEGLAKPDPEAYRAVLKRLGVEPHEAVFVDDTRENVEAAQALGLQGIVFTTAEALTGELDRLGVLQGTGPAIGRG